MTTKVDEKNAALVQSGQELAEHMMHSAVTNSKDVEQMLNQIFVLSVASSVILATSAFNAEAQSNANGDEYLERWFKVTRDELNELRKIGIENMDCAKTKDAVEGPAH